MIDLHCHLLPGVDDGPGDLDQAVDLALASSRSGITTAVATPHFSERYPTSIAQALDAAELLRGGLARADCELELLVGSEISIHVLGQLDSPALRDRTLGGGDCLLIESPFGDAPEGIEMLIHDLQVDGFTVLLAHPERSAYFHSNPAILESLVGRGAMCSITAGSFQGSFGRRVRAEALRLAAAGLAHNVSSDTHDLDRRPPGLDVGRDDVPGLPSENQLEATSAILLGR